MKRRHLFEWEDQPWLPRVFRDFITDHLKYTHQEPMRAPLNRLIADRLASLLAVTGERQITDLCAGAGGPLVPISRILTDELKVGVKFVATDLYPNLDAFESLERESAGRVRMRPQPVSAFDVPVELGGLRTIFTAFHHFSPDQARRVLRDAQEKEAALAVFEPLERTVRMCLLLGIGSFVRGLTHTHRVGPMTPARFIWTYLVPVAPVLFAWDGVVSVLRSYTAGELRQLAADVSNASFTWETGRLETPGPYGPMPMVFLVGYPGRQPGKHSSG